MARCVCASLDVVWKLVPEALLGDKSDIPWLFCARDVVCRLGVWVAVGPVCSVVAVST